MDFGYVRVSTKEQNPARQVKILMELGIEERNIYVEKKSGGEAYSNGAETGRKELPGNLSGVASYHKGASDGYSGGRYENSGYFYE